MSDAERAVLTADLASPHGAQGGHTGDDEGPLVDVPDEIPAWMTGLIP